MPTVGERVPVWPAPQHKTAGLFSRVLKRPGAFLLSAGETCEWTPFLESRFASGEVWLHDPNPAPAIAAPKSEG